MIPHLFEPLVRKSIDVKFAYWPRDVNFSVWKGDSDLDRPNAIEDENE